MRWRAIAVDPERGEWARMDCFRKSLFPEPMIGSAEARTLAPSDRTSPAIPYSELAAAYAFVAAARAPATTEAYERDFADFERWCQMRGIAPLPAAAQTLAVYLASQAQRGLKPATLARRTAAIAYVHRRAGHEPPTAAEFVRAALAGIRRLSGTAPARRPPILRNAVQAMVAAAPSTLAGLRDRALILLGFGAALRRAELVALDVDDLQETEAGLLIRIRRSKGDQVAAGVVVALPYGADLCPIAALRQWLEAARIDTGPVFRPLLRGGHVAASRLTGRSVANIIKQCAARAGLDPRLVSPHGLRAGLLTEAACRGATIPKLLEISRHRQIETLRAYLRPSDLFADHAATGLL